MIFFVAYRTIIIIFYIIIPVPGQKSRTFFRQKSMFYRILDDRYGIIVDNNGNLEHSSEY